MVFWFLTRAYATVVVGYVHVCRVPNSGYLLDELFRESYREHDRVIKRTVPPFRSGLTKSSRRCLRC